VLYVVIRLSVELLLHLSVNFKRDKISFDFYLSKYGFIVALSFGDTSTMMMMSDDTPGALPILYSIIIFCLWD